MNTIQNKALKKRILDLSFKYKLSHIGSCITAADIIDEIFQQKKPDEKFVLSSGHAGLALYVVIEKYADICLEEYSKYPSPNNYDAEKIWLHHGVHPDRCAECHIDCSGGSLGQGLPIAVGMALADRSKTVYCLISDGECSEGSIWEALRIKEEQKLKNLKVYCNINQWGAYKKIDGRKLASKLLPYDVEVVFTNSDQFSFLKGQDAHYHVMSEEEYKEGIHSLI